MKSNPQNINQMVANVDWSGMNSIFSNFAKTFSDAMRNLANAINHIGATLKDANLRMIDEHPADWVARVGIHASGHNITDGEMWRYRANLDWWRGDKVPDQYGDKNL